MPEQIGYPTVQGRCPACGNTRLYLGDGGYVTCPRIDCPEPDAASTLLEEQRGMTTVTSKPDPPVSLAMPCALCGHARSWHDGLCTCGCTNFTAPKEA
ncbi:DUF6085 family protein [Streptomyces clavifer]|uniref:DUF6085 family protein n=1 Tax=Streptomyces clavifer TaxID=68188 RepID=UPI00332CCA56